MRKTPGRRGHLVLVSSQDFLSRSEREVLELYRPTTIDAAHSLSRVILYKFRDNHEKARDIYTNVATATSLINLYLQIVIGQTNSEKENTIKYSGPEVGVRLPNDSSVDFSTLQTEARSSINPVITALDPVTDHLPRENIAGSLGNATLAMVRSCTLYANALDPSITYNPFKLAWNPN